MKKTTKLALLFIICLAVLPILGISVFAAEPAENNAVLMGTGGEPVIRVESRTACVGETFAVKIAVENNPGFNTASFRVQYDPAVLRLVGATLSDLAAPGTWYSFDNLPNVTLLRPDDIVGDCTFVTLFFSVEQYLPSTVTDISLSYKKGNICDSAENVVDFTCIPGTVSIVSFLPGDVNGDGHFDSRDLTRLLRYLNKEDVNVISFAVDVNDDGKTNTKDLIRLLRYMNQEFTQAQIGHHFVGTCIETPTCLAEGKFKYTCENCNASYTLSLPIAEHTFAETIVQPTEYTDGYTLRKCIVCAYEYRANVIPASGDILTFVQQKTERLVRQNGNRKDIYTVFARMSDMGCSFDEAYDAAEEDIRAAQEAVDAYITAGGDAAVMAPYLALIEKANSALSNAIVVRDAMQWYTPTGESTGTSLSEAEIQNIIDSAVAAVLSGQDITHYIAAVLDTYDLFDNYDTVSGKILPAISKIYMDLVKIDNSSYRPDDFVMMYNTYLSKYLTLNVAEVTGSIDQQYIFDYLDYSSIISTVITMLRMSGADGLSAIVADFDAAAAVVSIDDKVKELADGILAIGTEMELTAVPAEFVTITGDVYSIGTYAGNNLPIVLTAAQYDANHDSRMEGKLFAAGKAYAEGELIYVANVVDRKTVSYDVMRVTANVENASATPSDFAVPATAFVVTVNDYAKYEALMAKVDAFVAWAGYVNRTNVAIDVKDGSDVETIIVAYYTENAFTVPSGTDAVSIKTYFPYFGNNYVSSQWNAEPSGVFQLIRALEKFDATCDWDPILDLLGVASNSDFYYISNPYHDCFVGDYVNYYYGASSGAYDFAAHVLYNNVTVVVASLLNADKKVSSVDEKFGGLGTYRALAEYKKLVDALEKAIADYELFNLGDNKAIIAAKTNLLCAKAYLAAYDVNQAELERETNNEKAYKKALSEMVNYLTVEYMSNTDAYKNKTASFIAAADTIVKDTYFDAVLVSYQTAAPMIKACGGDSTFSQQLEIYMTDRYYRPALAMIAEAYAEYSWWLTVKSEAAGLLDAYVEQYRSKETMNAESALPYFVSKTDATANKYYLISEVLYGCKEDKTLRKAALAGDFNTISKKLASDIDAFMAVTPAKGTYLASCNKVLAMIDAAILDVAEKYLSVVDAKFGYKAAALAAAQAKFDVFKVSMAEILTAPDVNVSTLGLATDIAKMDAALKAVAAADKKYPVMSLIGDDEIIACGDLFDFEDQYAAKEYELECELMKLTYEIWFTAAQNKCYEEMSTYYKGSEGGVLYDDIRSSVNVITCMNDMSVIFNAAYKALYAKTLSFTIPSYKVENGKFTYLDKDGRAVATAATAAKTVGDFDAFKAYYDAKWGNDGEFADVMKAIMEGVILPDLQEIVDDCIYMLESYSHNRAEYDRCIDDAQMLVAAIENVNTINLETRNLAGFYVAGSKFDLALTNLKNVIANAKYVLGTYTVDVTTATGRAFVAETVLDYGFDFDLNNGTYNAAEGTWTAKTYLDARLYTEWCIADAKYALAQLWANSNPLLNENLDPVAYKKAIATYNAIVDAVGALVAAPAVVRAPYYAYIPD